MRRGEVWWADLPHPSGRRPVVLLSRDEAYAVRSNVTLAPVTTRVRHIPTEVALGVRDGLPRECVVNLDDIATVPTSVLSERISTLSRRKLESVEAAIRFALGMRA